MSRDESIVDIMAQLDKLTDEELEYLSRWSMPLGVLSVLRDYECGKLMRDCDAEMKSLLDRERCEAALDGACAFVGDQLGTCPLDMFGFEAKDCDEECYDRYGECWRRYFEEGA